MSLVAWVLVGLLAAVTVTFICMIAIQAAIDIATWGRGYWYVYGPVLALLAWFVWKFKH